MAQLWPPQSLPPVHRFILEIAKTQMIRSAVQKGLIWEDWHGFESCQLKGAEYYAKILGIPNWENMRVDMVRIRGRVPNGCHFHKNSQGSVLFLGRFQGLPSSPGLYSQYYCKDSRRAKGEWRAAHEGTSVFFETGAAHDFFPHPGGELVFLSVQEQLTLGADEQEEDYHLAVPDCDPRKPIRNSATKLHLV